MILISSFKSSSTQHDVHLVNYGPIQSQTDHKGNNTGNNTWCIKITCCITRTIPEVHIGTQEVGMDGEGRKYRNSRHERDLQLKSMSLCRATQKKDKICVHRQIRIRIRITFIGFHIQGIFFWCFWCKLKYRKFRKSRNNVFTINIARKQNYKNIKYSKFTIFIN